MLEEVRSDVKATIAPLLSGILDDTRHLIQQEATLARTELRQEFRKAQDSAISFGIGAVTGLLCLVMLCVSVAHLLSWAIDDLPLWGSFGIVALALGGTAAWLLVRAKNKAARINVVPQQTVETLKENAEWMANRM